MKTNDKTICNYCGKEKDGLSFIIGASRNPDWVMVYGTGKITCPECLEKATKEGIERVENHVKSFSK